MRFVVIMLATLFIDLLSKFFVMQKMSEGQSIAVWPNLFHLTYIQNPGAAFGLLAGQTWFFIGVTGLVLAGMAVGYGWIRQAGPLYQWAFGLVAGGAVGNLADRIRFGKVIDFLDFRIWPVFNLADTAICLGVGLILLDALREFRRQQS
ncbi:signal peptidase II [Desulforamulus hydrothermalis]|uniref:Lipoprotein signal peptidase n=1 Tax=Desulforamulus hydrothermalis Lam5 = DSM 18033 TaxID=1121428 RepID=K8E6V1_9FIRM|nr:signal peptidase II [Desulforamulus hydrothermalis]CCO07203.1 Lipoprotein signal peptidase [Desulforamulus hydrothermalis Lam5 = DSM 18033]SHG87967.1 signal peptidase II . Aspartic peptidase. MEROPS family A08 [Desulforamulus hydrothermalis Lam5 = DSM 18033]